MYSHHMRMLCVHIESLFAKSNLFLFKLSLLNYQEGNSINNETKN